MMRFLRSFAATLVVATAALATVAPGARAQQPAQVVPSILVVDVPLVMRESKVGKSIGQQLTQQQSVFQKEISSQERELQNAGNDLKRQEQILARDAYEARARELQQRADELQRTVGGKREVLQRAEGNAGNEVLKTVFAIVHDIASERRATHVLVRSPQIIAYVDPAYDITDEVLRRVDQRMPALAVNFSVPPSSQPAAAPAQAQSAAKGKGKKSNN
jgi:outer membrane protein